MLFDALTTYVASGNRYIRSTKDKRIRYELDQVRKTLRQGKKIKHGRYEPWNEQEVAELREKIERLKVRLEEALEERE